MNHLFSNYHYNHSHLPYSHPSFPAFIPTPLVLNPSSICPKFLFWPLCYQSLFPLFPTSTPNLVTSAHLDSILTLISCTHVYVLHTMICFKFDGFTNIKELLLSKQRLDKNRYHIWYVYYFLNLLSIYKCFCLSPILEHHLHTSTWFGFMLCNSNTTHFYLISNIYLQVWKQVLLGNGKIISIETSSICAKIT